MAIAPVQANSGTACGPVPIPDSSGRAGRSVIYSSESRMTKRILWEGSFFSHHSLALVNRELVAQLAHHAELDVAIRSGEAETDFAWDAERVAELRRLEANPGVEADVVVRHRWPFDPHPPAAGKWVIFQPWEYGAIPRAWYDPMRFAADEVWTYSTWNRDRYIEAGLPEEKVHAVPLGVHPVMLTEPEPFPLRTRKRFKFLFVGGTIPRKGIDLLLDAYVRAFGSADDVCLVIKDFGVGTFYKGQTYERFIRELQRKPGAPEIEYLTDDLTPEQLRDLYHACDCLVHPFRGEGWGLPIMEAMACGLPVIVPDQGGAADFCTSETAILLPARRVNVPPAIRADLDTIGMPWWLEVNPAELRERMWGIYENFASVTGLARQGQAAVRARLTWDAAAEVANARLRHLAGAPTSPLVHDADARYELRMQEGAMRWERAEPHAALRCFVLARALRPTTDAEFNVASILHLGGDHRTAAPILDRLVRRTEAPTSEDERQLRADVQALLAQGAARSLRTAAHKQRLGSRTLVRADLQRLGVRERVARLSGGASGGCPVGRGAHPAGCRPRYGNPLSRILPHPEGAVPQAGTLRRPRFPARAGAHFHHARG